jgi:ABC-2 type transport system ATP-binding protein
MLEVRNITKTYGDKTVLQGLGFRVQRGETAALLGENGSGKSTTFRIILGLLEADRGEVTMDGRPVDRRKIGYLPEQRSLYGDCSLQRQIELFGALHGMSAAAIRHGADVWLKRLKLDGRRDEPCARLSKGNQQKAQWLLALLHDPALLILDEPFTGLDEDNRRMVQGIIAELQRRGRTILLSSHQDEEAETAATRFLVLHRGKIGIDVEKRRLENLSYRIVETTGDNGAAGRQPGVLRMKRCGGRTEYLMNDEPSAWKLIGLLRQTPPVTFCQLRPLGIRDLIGELS